MSRLRDMRGITLLEVTIALFVLAIGLLGLAGLQLVALRDDTLGQQATLATTLAKDKVAELQEVDQVDQLTNGNDTYVDQVNGVTYARQWIVQPELSELSQMEMVTVKVEVSWPGAMVDRAVTVNAVVSRT